MHLLVVVVCEPVADVVVQAVVFPPVGGVFAAVVTLVVTQILL